jgi:hypothetical protein
MKKKTASLPPGARISNRADLIQALTVASQLEHGLMLMYLYAAFSMKAFPQELQGYSETPDVLRDKLRNWESRILRVARQEMEHLGFVCNMLSAIGGNQYFDRPNFPQVPQFWPVDLPIELERFGVNALLRFLAYEKPENLDDPQVDALRTLLTAPGARMLKASPQPIEPKFKSLGELYIQIRTAFETLPEDELFLVPPSAQVDNDTLFGAGSMVKPVYEIYLFKTYDRQSTINAIDEIIEQGEGTLTEGPITLADMDPTCHYMLFRSILVEYLGDLKQVEPRFEGARKCVRNPAFELHQDTITRTVYGGKGVQPPLSVAVVTHPWSRALMGVSNTAYETLMQLLVRLYTFSGDNSAEVQGIVNTVFFPMMTMVIRPLSELVSLLPAFARPRGGYAATNPDPGYTAGPGFEYFRTIGFLPHKPAAWITIHERLLENATNFAEAIDRMPADVRQALVDSGYEPETALPFIRQNLFRIASNFKLYMNF